jgi:hypothetical protein
VPTWSFIYNGTRVSFSEAFLIIGQTMMPSNQSNDEKGYYMVPFAMAKLGLILMYFFICDRYDWCWIFGQAIDILEVHLGIKIYLSAILGVIMTGKMVTKTTE